MNFICPICNKNLIQNDKSYACKNNHNFDKAKSGYVNLLTNSNKNSKIPGDNKLMVNSRRDFLSKGYYLKLSNALNDKILSLINNRNNFSILDAGCGEGYYLNNLENSLKLNNINANIFGVDISKFALNCASKTNKNISYAVASVFNLPINDKSCDILLNIFAPFCQNEFERVLKKNGLMILVIPSTNHLWELKSFIYDNPYQNQTKDYNIENFKLMDKEIIKDTIHITNNTDIKNLFTMTPYYYKTSLENTKKLDTLESLKTKIEFEILVYKKIN